MSAVRNNPKRETILAALAKGDVVSGAEISASLGVTRAAVWKQINALRAEGYAIPGDPRSGYRLLAEGERAYEASLLRAFGGDGRRVVFYRATGSTNTDLKELAAAGAPAGTVCVAESQSGGRGRRGRSFASPAGGAYFSLLLRPDLALSEVSALTGAVAVAVARVLEEMTGLSVGATTGFSVGATTGAGAAGGSSSCSSTGIPAAVSTGFSTGDRTGLPRLCSAIGLDMAARNLSTES